MKIGIYKSYIFLYYVLLLYRTPVYLYIDGTLISDKFKIKEK